MIAKPLGNRVIIRPLPERGVTRRGIIIPHSARAKPSRGVVLATGRGEYRDSGRLVPLEVVPGDEVLFSKYGSTEIKVNGEDLLVLKEQDVLVIVIGEE